MCTIICIEFLLAEDLIGPESIWIWLELSCYLNCDCFQSKLSLQVQETLESH